MPPAQTINGNVITDNLHLDNAIVRLNKLTIALPSNSILIISFYETKNHKPCSNNGKLS